MSQGSAGNVIAAIASLFVAGLGQLVQGRLLSAFLFFVVVYGCYALYFLVIPLIFGGCIHLWCIINAARYRPDHYYQ